MRDYVAATRAALAATEALPTAHEGPYFRTVGYRGRSLAPSRPGADPARRHAAADDRARRGDRRRRHAQRDPTARVAARRGRRRHRRRACGAPGVPATTSRSGCSGSAASTRTRGAAYDHARRALAFYFAIPYFRALLEPYGFTEELDAGEAALARGDRAGMVAAVSDRLVDEVAIAGTPQEAVAKLRAVQAHADYVVLSCTHAQEAPAGVSQARALIETFGPVSRQSSSSGM